MQVVKNQAGLITRLMVLTSAPSLNQTVIETQRPEVMRPLFAGTQKSPEIVISLQYFYDVIIII